VHTQSTKSSSNGCAAPGGMDDRFDFVLISDDIEKGNKRVKYLPGSYRGIGQDGQHFNKSIIASPTNNSVPNDVLYALYYNSDHLPVTMQIVVDKTLGVSEIRHTDFDNISLANPIGDVLNLTISTKKSTRLRLEISELSGQVIWTHDQDLIRGKNALQIYPGIMKSGIYLAKFIDTKGNMVVKKLVKN
jgi:hypothetical protein